MTLQWFSLARALYVSRMVGGPVELFGLEMWCMWTQDPHGTWNIEALRVLNSGRAIVEIARLFPNESRHASWARRAVADA